MTAQTVKRTQTRATFTPGPWQVERRGTNRFRFGAVYAVGGNGRKNFICGIDGIPIADARLIAAAPEMAAMLRKTEQIARNNGAAAADAEDWFNEPAWKKVAADVRALLARIDA